MFHGLRAIFVIATLLAACAPAATPAPQPDSTLVALKATLAAEATAAAAVPPTTDQAVLPCSLGQDLAWRYTLVPAMPMVLDNRTAFAVDGYTVAVNVEGLGPWRLEFGYPSQLGPFTGLCFILSGENVVLIEGAYYVPQPQWAMPVP